MSEKLHIPSHRYGNKEYRDNFDKTFREKNEKQNMGNGKKRDRQVNK